MTASDRAAAAVRVDRLWRRHEEAARIGAIAGGGVNRQAFSKEDIEVRRALIEWARPLRLDVFVDGVGNLFLRRRGLDLKAPPVMAGSHMDTQPEGGRFDGMFGVLAGLEAIEAMEDAGVVTRRSIEVVAWSNEEGGRFAPGTMGSAVFTGSRSLESMLGIEDARGTPLREALALTLAAIPEAIRRTFGTPTHAYIEAHIEQGPILDACGDRIGVVTGIQGCRWHEVEIGGATAHAGTTPLADRRDALQAAVRAVTALNGLIPEPVDPLRFTVGRFVVLPGSPNSVASRVVFTIDVRHPDDHVLDVLCRQFQRAADAAAAPCTSMVRELVHLSPCTFDTGIVEIIERWAKRLGFPCRRMQSGAFHDAGHMSAFCPSAMIFVPCERGISHNVAENARPDDLAAGTRVLAATLVEVAGGSR